MTSDEYLDKIEQKELLLKDAEELTEEELQEDFCTTDSKEEILYQLKCEIDDLIYDYEEAVKNEEKHSGDWYMGLDPAFNSFVEVNMMFV